MTVLCSAAVPLRLQVDRVLAERCGPGRSGAEGRQYLVAWQQLPLEQASWEEEEVRGVCLGCSV
jgi:hypothetical protein